MLVGLGWNEASAGDPARAELALAAAAALGTAPDPEAAAELEIARLIVAMRLSRFAECEAIASRAGITIDHLRRPDLAYVVWTMTACALACSGDLDAALRCADRGIVATYGIPVVTLPCLAARAHLLSRMGRHQEASAAAVELIVTAERLDSTALLAVARYDAGLVALAAGRAPDAVDLIGRALADGAVVSRPAARLALAEARAAAGDPAEATAELRRAALEPVSQADQPWTLVPQIARVQALIARAEGDHATARRRFGEAADGWRRRTDHNRAAGEEYMAALVDLGRPPVVGLVDPAWELRRVLAERRRMRRRRARFHPDHPHPRPGRGGVEARVDPIASRWWAVVEPVRVDDPDAYALSPDGYPDFPMPQRLRTDRAAPGHHLLPALRHRRHLAASPKRRTAPRSPSVSNYLKPRYTGWTDNAD